MLYVFVTAHASFNLRRLAELTSKDSDVPLHIPRSKLRRFAELTSNNSDVPLHIPSCKLRRLTCLRPS